MAWYDFQCEKCGAEFEKDMPMGSGLKPKCPACGSARTTKVFSAAGIAFKGSGFYVTDSRKPAASPSVSGTEINAKDKDSDKGDKAASDKADKAVPSEPAGGGQSSGDSGAAAKADTDAKSSKSKSGDKKK